MHPGEIHALVGENGAGKSTLMRVLGGIGLAPESRKEQGIIFEMAIRINVTMAHLAPLTRLMGFIRGRNERETAQSLATSLNLKAGSVQDPVSSVSGGNQQKVVLAKWFHANADLLIFDEPTRGVDDGAKSEIYALIKRFAAEGRAVLVVSSEHHEFFGLCDRVLVMREGALNGESHPDGYTEENLLKLAMPGVGEAA